MLIPAKFTLPLTRYLRVLFRPNLALVLLWASAVCHGLVYAKVPGGATALFASIPGSVYLIGYLLLLGSVLFHEFGHLSACRYYRCPHGEIRFGLYLLFPVFYANVTSAWRLEQKQRIVVDLGGMYFQLILTIPAFLLYRLTREPAWLLLFLELDAMILFCLNPFLRFDGYWLCSDFLGVPNLRARSRLLARLLWGRLVRRSRVPAAPFLAIRPAARLGLGIYAIGTFLFSGLVLLLFFRFLAPRILALPSEVETILRDGLDDWLQGNVAGMIAGLVRLIFLGLLVLVSGRILAQGLGAARKTWRHLWRGRRRGTPRNL